MVKKGTISWQTLLIFAGIVLLIILAVLFKDLILGQSISSIFGR